MIAHILLLPHPEHRERLLAAGCPIRTEDGRFGWVVTLQGTPWVVFDDGGTGRRPNSRDRLVLARDVTVVPEGVDRLGRVLGIGSEGAEDRVWAILAGKPIGKFAAAGTLVLLDADGEVSDV